APTVFINGKPAHRMGDTTQHCGGGGKLIEGSSNVIIGSASSGGGGAPEMAVGGGGTRGSGSRGATGGAHRSRPPSATARSVAGPAAIASGAAATGPAKQPERKAWIGIKVLDELGNPLKGATVRVLRGGTVVATATVGDGGQVRLDELPESGTYDVE